MTQSVAEGQISDTEMTRFVDLIYKVTGIRISQQKKTLLSNRIRRRLKQTGTASFEAYYLKLKKLPPSDAEWDRFLEEITTHETFLFRDQSHWDWLQKEFLAGLNAREASKPGLKSLRIWSAACSTGDEPTTIATCIAGTLHNLPQWNVRVVATDIGIGALEHARKGIYGERAMHLVPETYKKRFFTKQADGVSWQANPILTGMISFKQHNLLDPLKEAPFDVVFLKNVLIYFDDASKKIVMEQIRKMIKPGGILVAGATEGITELLRDMKRLQPWLYQTPEIDGTSP
jgi:chemotaxis protein methyltransferase CheR